jgi:hypothetical protein
VVFTWLFPGFALEGFIVVECILFSGRKVVLTDAEASVVVSYVRDECPESCFREVVEAHQLEDEAQDLLGLLA